MSAPSASRQSSSFVYYEGTKWFCARTEMSGVDLISCELCYTTYEESRVLSSETSSFSKKDWTRMRFRLQNGDGSVSRGSETS